MSDLPLSTRVTDPVIQSLGIEQLSPNPHQPRKQFKAEKLAELAETIREYGILQPVVVKKRGLRDYIIIAGERRWRAAQLAGYDEIKCIVMEVEDKTVAAMALIENLQREDLNPIEEANALHQYMMEFDCTQEELAQKRLFNSSR